MYDYLLDFYLSGRIDETHLDNAVSKMWISVEEKQQIIASKQVLHEVNVT
jgi:hypothetical protein